MIIGNVCTECGSDRMGYICRCGKLRCSCSRECLTCEAQAEYDEQQQQQQHEAEEQDRANFEDEMDRKYGR